MVSAAHPPARHRARVTYRGQDLSTLPVPPEPHPEMTAETRQRHLWLVESAVCFHGADADAISAAVVLPLWNVKRALFALGLGPDPNPKCAKIGYGSKIKRARAWLKKHGRATTAEIARAVGLMPSGAGRVLANRPDLFRVAERRMRAGRPALVWEAVPAKGAA